MRCAGCLHAHTSSAVTHSGPKRHGSSGLLVYQLCDSRLNVCSCNLPLFSDFACLVMTHCILFSAVTSRLSSIKATVIRNTLLSLPFLSSLAGRKLPLTRSKEG
ncbi:hypothetical protein E2C01_021477 [Portunus trituberculatus]|uniref:Uncharacterized protein n=1 Tax=Portunus trituberculatus TaxID=210409 RepID=A0A5B7E4K3_PORTR|nr:hypothetical protein [Portunus trituberculatus]